MSLNLSQLPSYSDLAKRLEQAKAEFIALLDQIRSSDSDLSPEAGAALAEYRTKVNFLDSVDPAGDAAAAKAKRAEARQAADANAAAKEEKAERAKHA